MADVHLPPARPQPASHIDVYLRVLSALMLRDMRSRFGGNFWGYLVQVLWPCVHLGILVGVMEIRGIKSPMGDSAMLFIATGALPALAFQYVSRELMKGYLVHKPLTYFPQVKRFDTVVARILVEIVSSFMGLCLILTVLVTFGVDPVPIDAFTAITGYLAALALGIGVGTINVGIVSFFPGWVLGYMLVTITTYLTAGVYFLACFMGDEIYYYMKWNPVTQLIEWVRLGYDPSLPIQIDYFYVYGWIFGTFTIGLLMERYVARSQQ
ncbi:ABC-2 type transporter [Methylorubrum extorquens]|uniref:ABC-2 type transporter n=1 Tax=Methylorubrum extorquens TaxID=408 RepID=A0A2N9AR06_METEX|nr:ABC transporter permease [Methylorubrum zatmanii]ARO57563.1 ABC transporter [Methylorubrum zatmanii]KQP99941.1 ABC transporter [Methylobacterium sp. Leaf121]SOR29794.1 ABC-2 type transporter [Methylorubrum extorquens]